MTGAPALLSAWQARIETRLDAALAGTGAAPRLDAAMRHAVLGGGKRLRPLLAYAGARAFGGDEDAADAAAVAVELVHAFSLVHDDLPAMDDDSLRRGRPTVHVAFDEATAILAGDALLAEAFGALAAAPLDADTRVALLRELAAATGAAGMCGGQALDMAATGHALSMAALEHLHRLKTGALIRAALRMGALSALAPRVAVDALDPFAAALGLAFQVRDDILDVESDSQALGKTAGKDAAQGKNTYPSLLGLDGAKRRLEALRAEMSEALAPLGARADVLHALADFAVARAR
jgi:farnesyl diphosphate synthase